MEFGSFSPQTYLALDLCILDLGQQGHVPGDHLLQPLVLGLLLVPLRVQEQHVHHLVQPLLGVGPLQVLVSRDI